MSSLTQRPGIKKITTRKYLLSVLTVIAWTIIAAEAAEPALDANGNTVKMLIPKDDVTIKNDSALRVRLFHFRFKLMHAAPTQ